MNQKIKMNTSLNQYTPQSSGKPNPKVAKLFHKFAILVLLLMLWDKSKNATCPSSVTSSTSASTQLDTLSASPSVEINNVEVGPVSAALYFMYFISSTLSAFVKLNYDGTKAWSKSVNFQILSKSLAVDKTENSVYFIKYISSGSPLIVGRLKASDGTLVDAQSQYVRFYCQLTNQKGL